MKNILALNCIESKLKKGVKKCSALQYGICSYIHIYLYEKMQKLQSKKYLSNLLKLYVKERKKKLLTISFINISGQVMYKQKICDIYLLTIMLTQNTSLVTRLYLDKVF